MASQKLVDNLASHRMIVDYAPTSSECLEMAGLYDYDIIVLDLGLAGSGYDILKKLRRDGEDAPVLALAPTPDADGRTLALQLGADDCMARPLDRAECLARIQAVVRRAKGYAQSVISLGDFQLDIAAKRVQIAGKPLHVTRREYAILELMALRKGSVLTREAIMQHMYAGEEWPDAKIVDVYISRLRRKIAEAGGDGDCIRTVWGRGFCLDTTPPVMQAAA